MPQRVFPLVIVLLFVACGRAAPAPQVATAPPPPARVAHANVSPVVATADGGPPEAGRAVLADRQTWALRVSRDCTQRYSDRALSARDRYDSWVDMDRGPSCHERYVGYGVYSLNGDGSDCRDAVGGIGADSGGLSEAAREYSEALTELAPLLAETSSYYHDERYRLDGCERGRELHSSLVSAFSRFDAADRTLELTSRRIEEELVAARLVELAADPAQHDAYVVDLTMERARGVVAAAEPLRVAHGRLVGDDGTFRTAAADLAEALTQLEQTPRAGDERFRARASAAADATRAVILRLDGEAFSSSERFRLEGGSFADEVFGSPQRLLASYNALVEAYNAL